MRRGGGGERKWKLVWNVLVIARLTLSGGTPYQTYYSPSSAVIKY